MLDNLKRSIKCFELVRNIAEEIQDPKQIIEAYKMLGYALQRNKEYDKAILCYKKMMVIAWVYGIKEVEMFAYNGLAIQNFYMGQIKESSYYQERSSRGLFESDNSSNKRAAIQYFMRALKERDQPESMQIEKEFGIKLDHKIG